MDVMIPGSPHVTYRGTQLFVEGSSLNDLATQFGTPLYVYSRSAMLDALGAYQRALVGRDHLICYAMKANSSLAVFRPSPPPDAASTSSRWANSSA